LTASAWSPFRSRAFAVIWTATVVSNIGSWMYAAGAGWLMTSLDPNPLVVSLVQVADSLPLFLFALPAGALADIVDRRLLLIVVEVVTTVVSLIFAALVWLNLVTPANLLLFVFLIGAAGALSAPAWQTIVSDLVPKTTLPPAIAANSVGVNVSRAIGPALGGVLISAFGIASPFWINGISNIGVVGALCWWRPATNSRTLPPERFVSAMRAGFRYTQNNPPFGATLVRAAAFFLFASSYWALLPLVARGRVHAGPELYGALLGAIGFGAVSAIFVLSPLRARFGANRLVAAGTIGTAVAIVLFGLAREPLEAFVASVLAGICWVSVLATLNVSAQVVLPNWVRGRGLAIYVMAFFGSLTVGSIVWGQLAGVAGLPASLFIAAAGAVVAIPLTWRWKLNDGAGVDLDPSMHWPAPVVKEDLEDDQGPVVVTVEYSVAADRREAFLVAINNLARERRRDGAYAWEILEDVAVPGRFLEMFSLDSWLEHLYQHERVTKTDNLLQTQLAALQQTGIPTVTHFIAARPRRADPPP
jgi:MFS family permease